MKVRNLNLVLWQGFLVAFPFYFLPSGYPRISDFFIVAILGRTLFEGKFYLDRAARPLLAVLTAFVAYIFGVNLVFSLNLIEGQFLQSSIFYIYNGLFFATALVLFARYREEFIGATLRGVLISLAVQVPLGLYFLQQGEVRQTIFFNNPNQLGYYALLAAAVVAYCAGVVRPKPAVVVAALCGCLFLALISLSKAAIIGAVLILALEGFRRPKLGLALAAALVIFATAVPVGNKIVTTAVGRIESIGDQGDDTIEGRGYDRIAKNPQYLAFGSGEGRFSRFNVYGGKELHSVFGTVLFSYGLVGSALGLLFLGLLCGRMGAHVLPLLPVAFYGITHQGLRLTMLWCVLAIAWCTWHLARERPA
jgi:hypothetical protein